jgi:hypothetical protein
MGQHWFYMHEGVRHGPVTQEQLCDLFRCEVLGAGTQVYCDSFKQWVEAGKIPALRQLAAFAATAVASSKPTAAVPPPLPVMEMKVGSATPPELPVPCVPIPQ